MEGPGWLASYADPDVRERFGSLELSAGGAGAEQAMRRGAERLEHERVTEVDAAVLQGAKGWVGVGAMDATERSAVLDALAIDAQFVFSTFAPQQFGFADDPELLYAGTRAHNRGMAAFCESDARLLAVGFVPLADVERSLAALDEALALGCAGIWIPHRLAGGVSPGHLRWDPFWARLQEAQIPFLLHVGGGRSLLPRGFHDNGRPLPPDFIGGGENLRGKDFPSLHHAPETMLSVMILDGVFDRFPDLRGGAIELGAVVGSRVAAAARRGPTIVWTPRTRHRVTRVDRVGLCAPESSVHAVPVRRSGVADTASWERAVSLLD